MFWMDNTFYVFEQDPNLADLITAFIADSSADVQNLPTVHNPGTQQGDDNVSLDPVNPGSMVFVISTSRVYKLNSKDEWVLQPKKGGGGGGGASALVDLTDVSIANLQDNQVIAWDAASQVFKNKTMEQVVHVDYSNVDNPPTINGVPLTPDTTLEDLGIQSTVDEPNEELIIGDGNNP